MSWKVFALVFLAGYAVGWFRWQILARLVDLVERIKRKVGN